MRRFFGKRDRDDESSKEELERQAAEELGGWMGAGAGAPPAGESTWSTPQAPPSQLGPPPQAPSSAATLGPSTTAPGPMFFGDPAAHSSGTPPEEEEAVTELALQQLADRSGGRLEDLAIGKPDPASAEAMRDRALSEFFQRKAELDRRRFEQEQQTRLRQPQLDHEEEEEQQLGPVEGPDELRLEEPAAPSEVRLDAGEEERPRRKAGAGSAAKAARKSTRKASGAKSSAKASAAKSTKKGSAKATKKGSAGRSSQKRKRPES